MSNGCFGIFTHQLFDKYFIMCVLCACVCVCVECVGVNMCMMMFVRAGFVFVWLMVHGWFGTGLLWWRLFSKVSTIELCHATSKCNDRQVNSARIWLIIAQKNNRLEIIIWWPCTFYSRLMIRRQVVTILLVNNL